MIFSDRKLKTFRSNESFIVFDSLDMELKKNLYEFAYSYLSTKKEWHDEWFCLGYPQKNDALIYLSFSMFIKRFSKKIDENFMVEITEDGRVQYSILP